jgi:hypothetical protein
MSSVIKSRAFHSRSFVTSTVHACPSQFERPDIAVLQKHTNVALPIMSADDNHLAKIPDLKIAVCNGLQYCLVLSDSTKILSMYSALPIHRH